MDETVRKELVEIVESDYARTSEFIARLIGLRTGVTALAVTIWTAAVGFGFSTGQNEPYLAATLAVLTTSMLDLSYAVHLRALAANGRRYEQALEANYTYVRRQRDTPRAQAALWRQFDTVEIGQSKSLSRITLKALWRAKDGRFFVLILLALASLGLFAFISPPAPELVCIKSGEAVIRVDKASIRRPGTIELVKCP